MPTPDLKRRFLHSLFDILVVIKGIDGFLEIIGGFLLMRISTERLSEMIIFLTQYELSNDPDDVIAHAVLGFASHLQIGTKVFSTIYLLGHGFLKVILVYNLLKERMWVFPVAIGVIEIFVLYQTYRFSVHQSIGIGIINIIDMLAIAFIWSEWRARRAVVGGR